ncbi:hypothetical protein BC826DRAFT_1110243 [Russula brevipes]|nr:hypothetical protein BC826DRAFT_1110243 [Russula brevipes]
MFPVVLIRLAALSAFSIRASAPNPFPRLPTNARPVDGSRCVILDAQIYVSPDHTLTGRFHFFNTAGIKFANVGHYFAWIHIVRPVAGNALPARTGPPGDDAGHVEDLSQIAAKFNVCGDIVRLLRAPKGARWNPPYCKISGPCE